jgi:hypothetical protein
MTSLPLLAPWCEHERIYLIEIFLILFAQSEHDTVVDMKLFDSDLFLP